MDNLITNCLIDISKNTKRKLTDEEINYIIDILQDCNLNSTNCTQITSQLSKKYTKEGMSAVKSEQTNPDNIHIVELLKLTKLPNIQRIFNPSAQYTKDYLVLDTENCSEILSGGTRFQWRYSATQNVQSGTVNSSGPINNIISMKLYQPNFPPIPIQASYNSIALVSMLIEEFSAQAFIASRSRKYHYLMRLAANTSFVPASAVEAQIEDYGDGIFNFKKPITTFDTITVSFADPIDLIAFPLNDNKIILVLEFTFLK